MKNKTKQSRRERRKQPNDLEDHIQISLANWIEKRKELDNEKRCISSRVQNLFIIKMSFRMIKMTIIIEITVNNLECTFCNPKIQKINH